MYEADMLKIEDYEGIIYLGRAPGYGSDRISDFRDIKALGVSKVYCLQEEDELLYLSNGTENVEKRRESLNELGIELVHSPVPDFGVPAKEQAAELVNSILGDIRSGKNILIHCMGGLGRTGTIAACVLAGTGIAPGDAVAKVRAVRPGTLETAAQADFVRGYVE